jgi:hypothetical protein
MCGRDLSADCVRNRERQWKRTLIDADAEFPEPPTAFAVMVCQPPLRLTVQSSDAPPVVQTASPSIDNDRDAIPDASPAATENV